MFCFSNSFRFLFVSCFDLIGFLSDLESTWKGGPGSSSLPWLPRHHQVVSSRFRSLPSCYWVSLVERRSWYRFVAMVTSTPPRYRVFRIMAFGCLFFFLWKSLFFFTRAFLFAISSLWKRRPTETFRCHGNVALRFFSSPSQLERLYSAVAMGSLPWLPPQRPPFFLSVRVVCFDIFHNKDYY